MDHKEYIRIVPGAKTAVLFIHGIVGSPNHFDAFVPLVPESVTVYNMLLDGHGKGVRDFSKTSMGKWETQVATAVDMLCTSHESIYICAHSMGTLFAIEQAIRCPKVKKLFLLAVPIKLLLKPSMLPNMWNIYTGKIKPDDRIAGALMNCCSIRQDKNIFLYLGWIPRYFELFAKIRQTRKRLHELKTPCAVFQSARDEMVAKSAAKLLSANPQITLTMLERSRHFYYEPEEQEQLIAAFKALVDKNT